MAEKETVRRVIITGMTESGRKFRPSDWAERLAGAFSTFGPGRRARQHPHIRVICRNGINCVSVDASLEEAEPMAWEFLMRFAQSNDLKLESEG